MTRLLKGFSNPTCEESDLRKAFEVPLLWRSFWGAAVMGHHSGSP